MLGKVRAFFTKETEDGERRLSRKRVALAVAVLLALVGVGIYFFLTRGQVDTDDAFVDGYIYTVTPRVSGYVTRVTVEDNQRVKAGDVLVELDPTDLRVALAQARADLASAQSSLAALQLGVPLELSQTSSRVTSAESELASLEQSIAQAQKEQEAAVRKAQQAMAQRDQAQLDLSRYTQLVKQGAAAQAELDTATTAMRTAEAELRSNEATAAALKRRMDSLLAQQASLRAQVALASTGKEQAVIKDKQALAQEALVELSRQRVRQAELNLGYTEIVSPVDGYVSKRVVDPGQMVDPGQALLSVVPLDPRVLWITANYKETQLTDVRPGQKVSIEVDTYPDRTLTGRVDSIMSGTGAVFSLFPPENASGNYVKIVQRIPVKIVLDTDGQKIPELRIGMSVVPVIYTR